MKVIATIEQSVILDDKTAKEVAETIVGRLLNLPRWDELDIDRDGILTRYVDYRNWTEEEPVREATELDKAIFLVLNELKK